MPRKTWPLKTGVVKSDIADAVPSSADALPMPHAVRAEAATLILGDSGSSEALSALMEATAHIRQLELLTTLKAALENIKARAYEAAGTKALKALELDEKCATAWHILAVSREKSGDMSGAFSCYEAAMKLEPENIGIANDIGRLAFFMGLHDNAGQFFRYVLQRDPNNTETINNYASSLRETSRYEEAIDLIRPALERDQALPALWNTLATVVNAQGDLETALLFFEEALKYERRNGKIWHNRGLALGAVGRIDDAIESLEEACRWMEDKGQIEASHLALAFCHFIKSDLTTAYHHYEARKAKHSHEGMRYITDLPPLDLSASLEGRSILVSAEQGLGDEILFASILPDLLEELGPDGHLTLGVEPRLVTLFARSFPMVTVIAHRTGKHNGYPVRQYPDFDASRSYDGFVMMGDLLPRYRPDVAAFPDRRQFLTPAPERVAYWKGELDKLGPQPKIGLLWKSLIKHSRRDRYYSPFENWIGILRTPGVIFINLQYGDVSAELAEAEAEGLHIWNPPGIDLRQDLDDLAALCAAMDLIMGPSNATSNIAAAVGTDIWVLTPPWSWPMLGTDHYPWYPSARMFVPPRQGEWAPALEEMRRELTQTIAHPDNAPTPVEIARAFQGLDRALLMRDWSDAEDRARALMRLAPEDGRAWQGLATALDRQNRLPEALDAYQRALARDPESLEIAADLAQLAFRTGMFDMAERFYGLIIKRDPGHLTAVNYYAAALREQSKFDQAIELLKTYLSDYPRQSELWDTLGTILMAQGDPDTAEIFFSEAITLDGSLPARFNRACLWIEKGLAEQALPDIEVCLDRFSEPSNLRSAELVLATAHLGLGRLKSGWQAYEARHMSGTPQAVHYDLPLPRLSVENGIAGKHVLIVAEQGLGDEIMFATLLPDLLRKWPDISLSLAVEPRLVPLFARTFPQTTVLAHHTETRDGARRRHIPDLSPDGLDGWCLMGDFLSVLRPDAASFAGSGPFLKPDPARVAYWRETLTKLGSGPKIGLLWKSLINDSRRRRFYPDFMALRPVFEGGSVCVNLQYGDTHAEQALAREQGLTLFTPPFDLTNDLDELSALCAALDGVIAPANAAAQIAAASGTRVLMLLTPGTWVMLGTDHYPWYPNVTPLLADESGWDTAMKRAAEIFKA